MEKCLLTHWCNYLSWINICSQAWVPSPLQHVPVPRSSAEYVYLCLFPKAVYLGTSCSNFSLWHPPPIQHLRIYVNILAAVIENTNVVTPPNKFFQFNHGTVAPLFSDTNYRMNRNEILVWCVDEYYSLSDLIILAYFLFSSQSYLQLYYLQPI